MVAFNVSEFVAAPPEEVFRRAADFEKAADVISGIDKVEMLTDGPVGVGTRFKETRIMFNRPCTEEMEVTEFEVGRRYVLGCDNHGCLYRSEIKVEPKDGGTELSLTFHAQPKTFMAKVMSIVTFPMTKMMLKHCAKDLSDLKVAVEGESSGGNPATDSA